MTTTFTENYKQLQMQIIEVNDEYIDENVFQIAHQKIYDRFNCTLSQKSKNKEELQFIYLSRENFQNNVKTFKQKKQFPTYKHLQMIQDVHDVYNRFEDVNLVHRVKNIIESEQSIEQNNISLRMIEWFVTTYSKTLPITKTGGKDIYTSFKQCQNQNKKKYFDAFRRDYKFYFEIIPGHFVTTTIGQLNFFAWIIDNGIIEMIDQQYNKMLKMMCDFNLITRQQKTTKSKSSGKNNSNVFSCKK